MKYELRDATFADEIWLEGLAESMKRGHLSIIEVGGVRVGMLQVIAEGRAVEIAEIQVDPGHQGRGLGTRVLLDVMAAAAAEGRVVRLNVGLRNGEAIRLYERLGFVLEGQSDTHRHMTYEAPR